MEFSAKHNHHNNPEEKKEKEVREWKKKKQLEVNRQHPYRSNATAVSGMRIVSKRRRLDFLVLLYIYTPYREYRYTTQVPNNDEFVMRGMRKVFFFLNYCLEKVFIFRIKYVYLRSYV